jgi:uncharacterized protein (DUF488 family)
MPNPPPIFTIGYGNRSFEDFLSLLNENRITFLVDVRTAPYSGYKPEFSKEALAARLYDCDIQYIFLGNELGGRPASTDCYIDGKVDYDTIRGKAFYKRGIDRIVEAYGEDHRLALMCSEGRPEDCHRSKLIGVTLAEKGIPLAHLDENGEPRTQDEVIARLTGGQLDLFGAPSFTSRKRYGEGK